MNQLVERLLNTKLSKFLTYYGKVSDLAFKEWWKFVKTNVILSGGLTLMISIFQLDRTNIHSWGDFIRDALTWKNLLSILVVYGGCLFITWLISFIRAPNIIYQQQNENISLLEAKNLDTQAERPEKRQYKIERLRELIDEYEKYDSRKYHVGEVRSWKEARHLRIEKFLTDYFDDSYIQRFEKDGEDALEDFLKELLD